MYLCLFLSLPPPLKNEVLFLERKVRGEGEKYCLVTKGHMDLGAQPEAASESKGTGRTHQNSGIQGHFCHLN